MSTSKTQDENPLMNILINVLLPTIALSKMSKEGDAFYQVGPTLAMLLALALPIIYGVWHWIKHKKLNIFSCVGLVAILLTGAITIYLWKSASAKPHVALIFGIKEAIQPLILGSLFLLTSRSTTPLFRTFIYNDAIFDIPRIEKSITERKLTTEYDKLIWRCTLFFFGSFCLSSLMNLGLSYYFLGDLLPSTPDWRAVYNQKVAKITLWGFVVIAGPMMIIGGYILYSMINSLSKLTTLTKEALLVPR